MSEWCNPHNRPKATCWSCKPNHPTWLLWQRCAPHIPHSRDMMIPRRYLAGLAGLSLQEVSDATGAYRDNYPDLGLHSDQSQHQGAGYWLSNSREDYDWRWMQFFGRSRTMLHRWQVGEVLPMCNAEIRAGRMTVTERDRYVAAYEHFVRQLELLHL